jgi:ribosomal protein S18 acetylase RimI-like enzyme
MNSDLPIEILEAGEADIKIITDIAFPAWEATYLKIVSREQFDFMYNEMYSGESLRKQFSEGHRFFILYENKIPAAFVSFVPDGKSVRIPKLYVHPAHQKKGFGKMLLDEVEKLCKGKFEAIELNVNRFNPARFFYEKLGFKIISEIDVPIGKYFMNDYIVRKKI